ncbi:MAG: NAD-dependent epimerase/dehydratase family protein [Deltaproteobacteria bacterium]|nr:NAD-dependent epimerase/dehydratase family protein [Deltaproteobacteria bacterium]
MSLTILVTGGAGYIGSSLVPVLLEAGHRVIVVDRFYFGRESLAEAGRLHPRDLTLVQADVRNLEPSVFDGVDAAIDLSGISNDPSCEIDPELTRDINLRGNQRVMQMALAQGVKRYIYASSCSVYGHGDQTGLVETSKLNPVSLYAKCKAQCEASLFEMKGKGMIVTALRFATVFGLSRRMRFDLAVNVMTKNAYTLGKITVDGGGKQWRPFVHVADVSETIRNVFELPSEVIDGEVFNVGHEANNIRVLNLAYRVRDALPNTQIVMSPTDPDLRDYNVRFDKLHDALPGLAFRTVDFGIQEVLGALKSGDLDPDDRRWYTLKHYHFLAEVEKAYRDIQIGGRILA